MEILLGKKNVLMAIDGEQEENLNTCSPLIWSRLSSQAQSGALVKWEGCITYYLTCKVGQRSSAWPPTAEDGKD